MAELIDILLSPEAFGYYESFSRNISNFLATRGQEVQLSELPKIKCWLVPLSDGAHLHIYAEQIYEGNSSCDQCRIIGTQHLKISIFSPPFPFISSLAPAPTVLQVGAATQ